MTASGYICNAIFDFVIVLDPGSGYANFDFLSLYLRLSYFVSSVPIFTFAFKLVVSPSAYAMSILAMSSHQFNWSTQIAQSTYNRKLCQQSVCISVIEQAKTSVLIVRSCPMRQCYAGPKMYSVLKLACATSFPNSYPLDEHRVCSEKIDILGR